MCLQGARWRTWRAEAKRPLRKPVLTWSRRPLAGLQSRPLGPALRRRGGDPGAYLGQVLGDFQPCPWADLVLGAPLLPHAAQAPVRTETPELGPVVSQGVWEQSQLSPQVCAAVTPCSIMSQVQGGAPGPHLGPTGTQSWKTPAGLLVGSRTWKSRATLTHGPVGNDSNQ